MQTPTRTGHYEERLLRLRERLATTLSVHTVRVLLARAIWQTAQRHPELAHIRFDDANLTFHAVVQRYATRPQDEIEAAFDDLCAEMLLLLARLLGRETAQRLAEELAVKDVPELDVGMRSSAAVNALGGERTDEPGGQSPAYKETNSAHRHRGTASVAPAFAPQRRCIVRSRSGWRFKAK